ncbi:IS5 family transposase [Roseomonas nepalensis]|uniref:IS5 family transposase n=1 Tax=Muricoccus nepalensis TaxID=1854500 RepID=A0A502G8T9_9PROT|nr:IS5 family transposase [Roseomonas nepalensis]TPG58041.1 IS5 family transposase [Roseomonas nepalensis]
MADLFWLTRAQIRRIAPLFPLSHGVPRVDDQRVVSGLLHVLRNGLRWRDAPAAYGPHKTLYNRFVRWSRLGVFNRIFAGLAGRAGEPERLMIDAPHLKAHRTAASLLKKGPLPRRIGRTRGGLNSKLHAVCDGKGRPVVLLLTEGQMSDHKGAALMLLRLPRAKDLLSDKGYDSNRFREALTERGVVPCITSSESRKVPIPYEKALYRQRHRIENMSGRLKDWRRIAMRYDRSAHTFMSAICLAATVLFWINES